MKILSSLGIDEIHIWCKFKVSGGNFFYGKSRQTYEESCIEFSNLRFEKKNFYEFLTQNKLQIFVIFTYFVKIQTFNAY